MVIVVQPKGFISFEMRESAKRRKNTHSLLESGQRKDLRYSARNSIYMNQVDARAESFIINLTCQISQISQSFY